MFKSKMSMFLPWLMVLNIVVIEECRASLLGVRCRTHAECKVGNAHCNRGVCACQPYYARVDNSTCLESTLLGSECVVSEQCTMKVAYSACLDGVCRCSDGHLQFRKHTCLSPAPPGHVCYSNEHCRLWDKESRCEFVILDLFGRCACNPNFKLHGERCIANRSPTYAPEAVVAEDAMDYTNIVSDASNKAANPTNTYPSVTDTFGSQKPDYIQTSKVSSNDVLSNEDDNPLMQALLKLPTGEPAKQVYRKDGDPNEVIGVDDMTANLHANDQPVYRIVTQPSIEQKSNKKSTSKEQGGKPQKASHQKKSSAKDKHRIRADVVYSGPASLGMACLTDAQCQLVDPYTRCLNKRCDCAFGNNSTSSCSARNRGCLPGTFQCRSTGTCISWYFVCDGRKDCPDGSDERCQGSNGRSDSSEAIVERCPMNSFRCGGPGSKCVSRASRCDGTPQCPGGEDEKNCRATKRKGCPRHTFRCGSGECIPEYEFCNAIITCKDASDEPPHLCNEQSRWRAADFCPLRCGNGRCRSTAIACSGKDGCGDNTDEIACNVCKCPTPLKKH